MAIHFLSRDQIWSGASYGPPNARVDIASGIASIVQHRINGRDRNLRQTFFRDADVVWQHLRESTTTQQDLELGKVKYYDVVVNGMPTLKDAAWQYVELKQGSSIEDLVGAVVFKEKTRPFNIGDGEYESGEAEGLHIVEDWFM